MGAKLISGRSHHAALMAKEGGPERCARCGAAMVETHCKVMCVNCGYMRDCNDQW